MKTIEEMGKEEGLTAFEIELLKYMDRLNSNLEHISKEIELVRHKVSATKKFSFSP